jgi:hypothetical protein
VKNSGRTTDLLKVKQRDEEGGARKCVLYYMYGWIDRWLVSYAKTIKGKRQQPGGRADGLFPIELNGTAGKSKSQR